MWINDSKDNNVGKNMEKLRHLYIVLVKYRKMHYYEKYSEVPQK